MVIDRYIKVVVTPAGRINTFVSYRYELILKQHVIPWDDITDNIEYHPGLLIPREKAFITKGVGICRQRIPCIINGINPEEVSPRGFKGEYVGIRVLSSLGDPD